MIGLALTLGSCVFLLLLGLAFTVCVKRSGITVPDVLLAPAGGIAIIVTASVTLNRMGLPVAAFAGWLTAFLALCSVGVIAARWKVVATALRAAVPFGAIALVALFIAAAPMMSFGSDWFSYANDDAVNYAMSAERMKMGGLFDVPPVSAFADGRDIRLDYYFLNGVPSERYGADEALAYLSSVYGTDTLRALMPLLVVLYISGIAATAALVYRGRRGRTYALTAACGLSVAALPTFGTDDQLLAQVMGVMFVSASLARACDDAAVEGALRDRIGAWVLTTLVVAGLFFAYPELTPFTLVAVLAYHLFRAPTRWRARAAFLAIVGLGTTCILNAYIRNVLYVLTARTGSHEIQKLNSLFPYYLLPTGLANLFGVLPIASFPQEPMTSVAILVGLLLSLAAAAATYWCLTKREPAGYLLAVYFCAAAVFAAHQTGFALFKLAMYMQPVLFAVLAVAVVDALSSGPRLRRAAVASAAVGLVALNVVSQHVYITASRTSIESRAANYAEIPDISGGRLFDNLDDLRHMLGPHEVVLSDVFNAVLAKIEKYYARDRATVSLPSGIGHSMLTHTMTEMQRDPFFDHSRDGITDRLDKARDRHIAVWNFVAGPGALSRNTFSVDLADSAPATKLWVTGSPDSPFNRLRISGLGEVNDLPVATPNILAFVDAALGNSYFIHRDPVAIYPLEPDFFGHQESMSGLGRYVLLQILNPRPPIRIHLALTETLTGDGENRLPPVSVIGTRRVFFGLRGRGSASVVSPPVEPRVIGGRSYVLIDMGTKAKRFRYVRKGLMRLWGAGIAIDPRYLTGFLRDASALAAAPNPPHSLTSFPGDLFTRGADFWGLYEDGWASEDFETTLNVGPSGRVALRGVIPLIDDQNFSTTLSVFVDDFPVTSHEIGVGNVNVPVMTGPGVHRIEWRFSRYQRLPGSDHRPVTVRISSIS